MADVLITPASGKIEFYDGASNLDAKIELDATGNLNITNPGGDISLGDTSADIFIGDGVSSVDIRFEQAGTITGQSGITLQIGESGSNVSLGTTLNLNNNNIINGNTITFNGQNASPSTTGGSINIQPSTSGGTTGIVFRSKVNETSDFGYVWWYDDNNNYRINDSTENGTLLIGIQNDASNQTSSDSVAIESSGDIWLNPGIGTNIGGATSWNSTLGNVYVGNAATRYKVWHQGNDGSGSGLDADTLDGVQGSSYLRSDASDTYSGILTIAGVVRSTNNLNVDGPNFNVSTTNKSTAEYAYRVDRSGSVVGGILIDGKASFNGLGVGTAPSGTTGEIRATNDVTAYYSDSRLKNFEGTIPNAVAKVQQLNGYYFTENETARELGYNNNRRQVGVSAQEVEAVLPEVVTTAPISDEYLTVKYEKMIPLLIEAIKEQQTMIDELKKEIANLKHTGN